MAGRYTKIHSNYVLRKKHQETRKGSIWVRDWVTIGGQHQIEKGKKPYYSDTNFLFTDNSYPSYKKRHNYGKWVAEWNYDDVKNAEPDVNNVVVNNTSNDIRDFVYYGSAVELVKSSVLNIIKWFPARVTTSSDAVYIPNSSGGYDTLSGYYLLNNPFEIDFIHELSNNEKKLYNEDRFLMNSYKRYTIDGADISSYKTINRKFMSKIKTYTEVVTMVDSEGNIIKDENDNDVKETYYHSFEYLQMFTDDEQTDAIANGWQYVDCRPITWLPTLRMLIIPDQERKSNEPQLTQDVLKSQLSSDEGITLAKNFPLYTVKINSIEIEAYIINNETVVMTSDSNLVIKAKQEVFDEYFYNLDGFEKQLLTLTSKPVYKNSFLTPIEGELSYKYVYRDYTWPSSYDDELGYGHIDITSQSYVTYVQKLIDMATVFDELWCDNLYRNMTHESIKNFDWTYTREYNEGEEQDNIDGGNRVMQLLRIYGRAFDDLKRLADGIGFVTNNTYDGFSNQPDAEITDRLEMSGWDITSTIPVYDNLDLSDVFIDSVFINTISKKDGSRHAKWFNSTNSEYFNTTTSDIEFMRRLMLSSRRIFQTKGTKHAIDMVMGMFGFGDNDYELTEKYYYTIPKNYEDVIDEVENINYYKNYPKYYDDIYSGIPLKDIFIGNNHFIVPYIDQKRLYDGDVIFESKGGWGKNDNDEYIETLSYLHVVGGFSNLLDVNPNSLTAGDIYYVVSLVDYSEYVSTLPENMSHFFVLNDGGEYNPQLPESWSNVDMTSGSDAAKKAAYLDSIISLNIGNNPHVGYGNYDDGDEFKNYMQQPFKYSVDEYLLPSEWMNNAQDFLFTISDGEDFDKVKVLLNDTGGKYYINRKWFQFENKLNSDLYKDYFKNVILKYIMQVIPSTTILILKGFE